MRLCQQIQAVNYGFKVQQAMMRGIAGANQQPRSAVGAFERALWFDLQGRYPSALQFGAGQGLVAGLVQVLSGLVVLPVAPCEAT